jgi:hypothetical protein
VAHVAWSDLDGEAEAPQRGGRSRWRWPDLSWRATPRQALRVAPWLVFGPITGFLCNRAVACFERKEPVLAWLYIVLNAGILLDIPLLTARLAERL